MKREKLLLHICCAPDLIRPFFYLKKFFKLYLFWYNPNIYPYKEYIKRKEEYIKFLKLQPEDYTIIKDDFYDPKFFLEKVRWLEKEPEWWKRCDVCYKLRLNQSAFVADKYDIPFFTTTLLISPKKNLRKLKIYWEKISSFYKANFLFFDFRKNNWFQKACTYTKKYNIYRQNYCWCVFSIVDLTKK